MRPKAAFSKGVCLAVLSNSSEKLQQCLSPAATLCMLLSFLWLKSQRGSRVFFSLTARPQGLQALVLNPNWLACCK